MKKRLSTYLTTLLFGLTILSGCTRDIESKNPIRSLPDMPPAPVHLSTVINDRSVTLSWEVSDTAAVSLYRIYMSEDSGATFTPIDSTGQFSRTVTGLPLYQEIRLRVTSVTSRKLESVPSEAVRVASGLMQMLIQAGDKYTIARNVDVTFSSPLIPVFVQMSEDPTLSDAVVLEYQSPMPFMLSQGEGVKTVYARLTFADGSESGTILSDDITLDTYARIDSVYFTQNVDSLTAGDTIWFYVAAHGEAGGGSSVIFGNNTRVLLRDLGLNGDLVAGDGIYSFAWVVPVGMSVINGLVSGTFTDAAGNNAVQAQAASRLNIWTMTTPTAVILAVSLTDSVTAHLSWTANTDNDFVSYRIYRSVSPNIDVSTSILSIITNQGNTTHDDYLSGTGTYYYKVFVFDSEGRFAGSNEVIVGR